MTSDDYFNYGIHGIEFIASVLGWIGMTILKVIAFPLFLLGWILTKLQKAIRY